MYRKFHSSKSHSHYLAGLSFSMNCRCFDVVVLVWLSVLILLQVLNMKSMLNSILPCVVWTNEDSTLVTVAAFELD